MSIIRKVPLMGLVLLAYNFLSFNYGDSAVSLWRQEIMELYLPSGAVLRLSYSMVLLSAAMLVLFIELIKSSTASTAAMIEQTLSSLVFVAFLIQFLVSPRAAEPTFYMLLIISLVEMLAGFIILTKVARHEIGFRQ